MLRFFFKAVLLHSFMLIAVDSHADYADPNHYLIDSLELDDLSDWDRELIDSTLEKYHHSEDDTIRLQLLEHLVDNCWDEIVWPKYNQFIIDHVQSNLTQNLKPEVLRKNKYYLAGAINNLGFSEDQKGKLGLALDYYHKSHKLYKEVGDKRGMSVTLNNIAVIQSVLGNWDKAIEYQETCIELKRDIGDIRGVAVSYLNLGHSYYDKKEPFKAQEYYEEGLAIGLQYDDKRTIAMAYSRIGDVYEVEKVLPKALDFYKQSLKYWEEIDSDVGISGTANSIASILVQQGKYNEAFVYAERSYALSDNLGYPQDIKNSSKTLSQIYEARKDYKSALKYYQLYTTMQNVLVNDETDKKAYRMAMQYEYERQALEDSLEFVKKDEVHKVEIESQKAENYALYGGMGLMLIIMFLGIRSLRHRKRVNELVKLRQEETEHQKDLIALEHAKVSAAHKEISDSITYAERIQRAILPPNEKLRQMLGNGFVLFKPKDVVSGDFYWLEEIENGYILAVADCTGHGVPGAMVSVVCHNALNRTVREFQLTTPGEILDKTRELVIEAFSARTEKVKDGMDISICKVIPSENRLEFAGAYNGLYLIDQNDEFLQISGDRQPVGRHRITTPFKTHELNYSKGDFIYLFTDGYPDQFGGQEKGKLKYSRFKELLLKGVRLDADDQKIALNKFFDEWRGDLEQIDDVCIIGVQL